MSEGLGFGRRKLVRKIIETHWNNILPENKQFSYNELLFIVQELLYLEGRPYLEGYSPMRGYEIFRNFVQLLLYRNLANYDSMVLISSDKGTGKSSAALMMGREWCKNLGIKFDVKRHLAYNNADVMRKIDELGNFEVLICLSQNTKIRIRKNNKETVEFIKNLVDKNDYEVLTYNIKKDGFEYQKPKKTILTKKDFIYKIELKNGKIINATENHLFLTKNGVYKKLKDLTVKDELILASKKCDVCGKEFYNNQIHAKTCSKKCARKNMIPYRIKFHEKDKMWHRKRHKIRVKSDICYRLRHNLLTRLSTYIVGKQFNGRGDRVNRIIGCSIGKLKIYLEKKFKQDMTWENYGHNINNWSIDHIIPLSSFDFNNKNIYMKGLHYTNIQPLWNKENLLKGDKYTYTQ